MVVWLSGPVASHLVTVTRTPTDAQWLDTQVDQRVESHKEQHITLAVI